jgi:tRNA threonylcarbamoyladenosine biosynthesis protein TsaE
MKIYHFDFYRIKNSAELFDIGFNDYLNDSEAVSFIEWGEMFPEMLPVTRYEVDIILYENLSRAIAIKKNKPIKIAIRK